jgi:hypothetical protein
MWSKWAWASCVAVWLVAAPARPAEAQETVNYASVAGRVVDASGAAVVSAAVTIRETETNVASAAKSDGDGRFRFPYLRVGSYELTVRRDGFATVTRALQLSAGAAFDLPVVLDVGTIKSEVTVSEDAPLLDTARTQIGTTIRTAEIQALPMNGRNFLDLALLAPGASPTNVGGGTQLFPETSAVPGVGLSVNSQRNLSNNFMVDGLSNNDDAAALSGIVYGVDAVDQFQVIISGGQAELGRALGGNVNVVTRSGTNAFAGSGYEYFRDDRLNAANALSGTSLPMRQNQYGASLGGPIRQDRTFFFANIEQKQATQSGLVTIPADTVALIDAQLAAQGYAGAGVSTGVYPTPIDSTTFLGKVDHQFSDRDLFSARYSAYRITSGNSRGAGGTAAPSASAGLRNVDQTIAVSNVRTITSRAVLETRAQFALSRLDAPPADSVGPAVNIAGTASFGTLSVSPTARRNSLAEVVNNLSYQAGTHALRAGVDLVDNDDTITFPRATRGSYTFASLAAFTSGVYTNGGFTQTFGATSVHQMNPNVGVYAQDEWAVRSGLTVNAGLRYDLQYLDTIHTDMNNLAPRLGVVWSPGKSSHTAVRVSGGRYFDRVPLRAVANALLSAGNTTDVAELRQISVSLSPGQTAAPAFPTILSQAVASSALVNFTTIDRHIQTAYSDDVSVEAERQIGRATTVAVGYDHLRGHNLIMQVNQNVPTCAVAGSNNGCRPVATYANDNQYSSVGSSVYNGVHVSIAQRPTRWGSYRVSYTLSKAMDDVGEAFFNAPIDNFDISKDWGRSDDDQRHRLVATGSLRTADTPGTTSWQRLTHGFVLTGMVQLYSALPFNITTGANTIQATAARPTIDGAFIARNSGVGSAFSSVNLRVSRTLAAGRRAHVELLLEGFNVLNRRNDVARIAVFGSGTFPTAPAPNFGQVIVVGDPRSFQLGLRVGF